MDRAHPDAELIARLGGPAAVARRLGFAPKNGVQRVQNWLTRGIPEVIRLRRTDVFGEPPPNPEHDSQAPDAEQGPAGAAIPGPTPEIAVAGEAA